MKRHRLLIAAIVCFALGVFVLSGVDAGAQIQKIQERIGLSGTNVVIRNASGVVVGTFTSGGRFESDSARIASWVEVGSTGYIGATSRSVLRFPAAGQTSFRNYAETNTYDITLADWGTTLSAEGVSLANDAVLAFPAGAPIGYIFASFQTFAESCQFELRGGSTVAVVRDTGAKCSVTAGTANRLNLSFVTDHYEFQNKLGSTITLRATLIGG